MTSAKLLESDFQDQNTFKSSLKFLRRSRKVESSAFKTSLSSKHSLYLKETDLEKL